VVSVTDRYGRILAFLDWFIRIYCLESSNKAASSRGLHSGTCHGPLSRACNIKATSGQPLRERPQSHNGLDYLPHSFVIRYSLDTWKADTDASRQNERFSEQMFS
jgi:hypothetical protein